MAAASSTVLSGNVSAHSLVTPIDIVASLQPCLSFVQGEIFKDPMNISNLMTVARREFISNICGEQTAGFRDETSGLSVFISRELGPDANPEEMKHELVLCRILFERLHRSYADVLKEIVEQDAIRAQELVHNYTLTTEFERVIGNDYHNCH